MTLTGRSAKETKEEAGLDVKPRLLIAVQDRNRHNVPQYAYGVVKAFVLCDLLGGSFEKNLETTEYCFFSKEELPEDFANEKNTKEQVLLCFEANESENWETKFD